jgi:hypothetical protein
VQKDKPGRPCPAFIQVIPVACSLDGKMRLNCFVCSRIIATLCHMGLLDLMKWDGKLEMGVE